jgi:hypothetical protein
MYILCLAWRQFFCNTALITQNLAIETRAECAPDWDDSFPLWYDAVSLDERYPTFRWSLVRSSSRVKGFMNKFRLAYGIKNLYKIYLYKIYLYILYIIICI